MKKKYYRYVGIDPDCEKSGVVSLSLFKAAPLDKVMSLKFCELIEALVTLACRGKSFIDDTLVVIEGGWLNQSNWHLKQTKGVSVAKAAAMGRSVGMNHQTGILIAQMCEALGLNYEVVKPLPKCWQGKDGKITAEELEYFTGWHGRSNQDARDAALLAWTYAGLPVKVKPIGGAHGKG